MDFGSFAPRPRDRRFPKGGGFRWTALFRAKSESLGARRCGNSEAGSENEAPELTLEELDVSSPSVEGVTGHEEAVGDEDNEESFLWSFMSPQAHAHAYICTKFP